MIVVAVLFALYAVVTAVWLVADLRATDLRLHPEPDRGNDHGLVSVVVPMRDELANVDRCLAALQSQSYATLEPIVVDDGSTDGTQHRLREWRHRWPALTVVTLDGHSDGWAGKAYALHRGAQQARGDWLLFVDADVELARDAVARAVATATDRDWPVLSITGRLRLESLWERVLLLHYAVLLHFVQVELPDLFLVGHFTLLRRSAYDRIGGFAAIPDAVSTDLELASQLMGHGVRPRLRIWSDAYRCRMYRSRAEVWQGLTRMLAAGSRFDAGPLAVLAAAQGAATVLPQLVLAWWLVALAIGGPLPSATAAAAAALLTVQWLGHVTGVRRIGADRRLALLKPIGDLAMFMLLLATARSIRLGRVTWKGRTYDGRTVARPSDDAVIAPADGGGYRLSIVVSGDRPPTAPDRPETARDTAEVLRRAATIAGVEVIVVRDPQTSELDDETADFRIVSADRASCWTAAHHGLLAARAPVVAFANLNLRYPPDWPERILAAFEDPWVELVTGPTEVAASTARCRAFVLREWGHLLGLRSFYPNPDSFAGRRELLLRMLPEWPFDRRGGEVVVGMLAAIERRSFRVLKELAAELPVAELGAATVVDLMASRLAVPTLLTRRATTELGHRSLLLSLLRSAMPVLVWADTALLVGRAAIASRQQRTAPGLSALGVALWLAVDSMLDLALAVRATVQPRWLWRRSGAVPAHGSTGTAELVVPADRTVGIVRRLLISPRRWCLAVPPAGVAGPTR